MKKTTAKEFKELMIEMYDKFDYDMIINELGLLEFMKSEDYKKRGNHILEEEATKKGNKLYDYLDNKGYYDYLFK